MKEGATMVDVVDVPIYGYSHLCAICKTREDVPLEQWYDHNPLWENGMCDECYDALKRLIMRERKEEET